MADYTILANGTRDFQLLQADKTLGALHYTEWFSFKAVIALANGSTFQIAPRGFWGTTIEVKDQEAVLLNFKMNWGGTILIKLKATSKAYVFNLKSLLKNTYVLQDKDERELLLVQPSFKWNTLNCNYTLTSTDEFESLDYKELLLLTTVHCANYSMAMAAGATTIAVAT